jgi:hypothetical protein
MKVILGINDPTNGAEDLSAVAVAKAFPSSVDGIVVGNEGLCWSKYSYGDLVNEIGWLNQELNYAVPLTTAEPLQVFQAAYYGSTSYDVNCNPGIFPGLLSIGDFVSVNIGSPGCDASVVAPWVSGQLAWLGSITGKDVVGHEVYQMSDWGPAASLQTNHWCSETDQKDFFCTLRSHTNSFSHFTAFDEPGGLPEAYGGLFTAERTPKLAALALQAC